MASQSLAAAPGGAVGMSEIRLYGLIFAGSVGAFCLAALIGDRFGVASNLVAIAGDATCGWSWLLVRALFQPATGRTSKWPLVLVLTMVVAGAVLRLSGAEPTPLTRMITNVQGLVSSALLLLAMIEPLTGLRRETPRNERRFRIGFSLGYATVLAVAVIWVNGAPQGSFAAQWGVAVKATCALLAVGGMGLAIWLRGRHPLSEIARTRRHPTVDDAALGERILRLMTEEALYTRADLKVADLARRLGQADYKVTHAITGPLGFRNFNQMANHFRIEDAKRRLGDPAFDHLPILTVAFDCGFGSIGPFNRAFKAETGMIPMAFRRARTDAVSARPGF